MIRSSVLSKLPGFYQVPEGHCALLEEFGKFKKELAPGLHFANPLSSSLKSLEEWKWEKQEDAPVPFSLFRIRSWIQKPNEKKWTCAKPGNLMELTEQQWVTNSCKCYTKDRVEMKIKAIIHFLIKDPYKAAYRVDILPISIHDACHAALRSEVSKYRFDPHFFSARAEFFEKQEELNKSLTQQLQDRVANWGVEILRAEIGPFEYDKWDEAKIKSMKLIMALAFLAFMGGTGYFANKYFST